MNMADSPALSVSPVGCLVITGTDGVAAGVAVGDTAGDAVGSTVEEVTLELIDELNDDLDTLTLLAGEDFDDEALEALSAQIEEKYPDLEVDAQRGEQPLYPIVFSIE